MCIKLGLRGKLFALSSLFLLLPWFTYQFVNEMESFLKAGQQQTLLGTTSGVAAALHERANLFNADINTNTDIENGRDLYVYNLAQSMRLDGKADDWQEVAGFSNTYRATPSLNITNPVQFEQLIGKRNGYLYALFKVDNKHPIIRPDDNAQLTKADHLIIAMSSPQGKLLRYMISVTSDGWFNAYRYPEHSLYPNKNNREKSIQGFWRTTNTGYNIELRLPLELLGNKLGFQLNTGANIDSPLIDQQINTSNLLDINRLGSVLIPSPEIKNILQAMSHTSSRLWVVDRFQRVIANTGDIHQANGTWPDSFASEELDNKKNNENSVFAALQTFILSPIYNLFLTKPDPSFIDSKTNPTRLNEVILTQALSGSATTKWRTTEDDKATILSAAHPIFVDGKVVGAVLAEETNHGLLSLRNQTLESLFNVLLAILIIAGLLLFVFISKLVKRITRLRDQSETMLDQNGRLTGEFSASPEQDEIGDLSRSMATMVQRLAQYHHYVEQLSSRLSHELRTPVAVVRSSLENLAALPADTEQQKYIERSQQGIQRLNKILTNMSEASRIEQSLNGIERQQINLNELVNGCMQGYQMIYPDHSFIETPTKATILINADPDFIVQLLDKLVHNAVEFSRQDDPITFTLNKEPQLATLSIDNKGPLLVEGTQQDLFQSMVSIRPVAQQHDTHLGLGLYIAKMICDYHNADLQIANNSDLTGVTVSITFPIILL